VIAAVQLLLDCNAVICHKMLVSTRGCRHLHLDARRHLRVDAADARSRHLLSDARPSLGSGVRDDPAVQAEHDGMIVPQFAHLSVGIPRAAGLLNLLAQGEVGERPRSAGGASNASSGPLKREVRRPGSNSALRGAGNPRHSMT